MSLKFYSRELGWELSRTLYVLLSVDPDTGNSAVATPKLKLSVLSYKTASRKLSVMGTSKK
ncbi:hypothetical protein FKM82_025728 [Ascaphus truei]